MLIFPAIDLFEKKAVRLFKGDYAKMTVYNELPEQTALDFRKCGASCIHIVDLEGAKSGETPNFETVKNIKEVSGLFCEIGGGIRSLQTIEKYLEAGIDRVIIGTAAIEDKEFLSEAVRYHGDKIAVGADVKDGYVAVKGWTQCSDLGLYDFIKFISDVGVKTVICTDISKDGAMRGTNRRLYKELSSKYDINVTASGGISSIEDIEYLRSLSLYGAIIGKAYYTGAIDLRKAIEVAK